MPFQNASLSLLLQIGLIFSCAPLIRSVAAVVWTMVADELSLHRSILWFSIVAGSVLHALFAVFPPDVVRGRLSLRVVRGCLACVQTSALNSEKLLPL